MKIQDHTVFMVFGQDHDVSIEAFSALFTLPTVPIDTNTTGLVRYLSSDSKY